MSNNNFTLAYIKKYAALLEKNGINNGQQELIWYLEFEKLLTKKKL